MGLSRKATEQELEKKARLERIKERKLNPKANPTNRDVLDAVNDLMDEIQELKQ